MTASPSSSAPNASGGRRSTTDLADPFGEIERLVARRRQAPAAGVLPLGRSSAPAATRDDARVVDAGAAFELMHAFALFHDDVMDDAASRRGAPTTHTLFADRARRASGWAGEARRFGEGVAILVGDLAFVYADQLLRRRAGRGVADVERAAHRAQRRPVPRHPRQRSAASVDSRQGRAHRPVQERQVHASSGRCTSAPLLAAPERAGELLAGARAPTACRSATPSRSATT